MNLQTTEIAKLSGELTSVRENLRLTKKSVNELQSNLNS